MKIRVSVDKDKCTKCGLCIKDCVTSSLVYDNEGIPSYVKENNRCNGCQHCMAVCPAGAVSFDNLNPDDSEPVEYGNSAKILRLMKSRRSIRLFKDESLTKDSFEKIREMLAYTPTGDNVDSLHFSIVGSKEKMELIRQVTYEKIMKMTDDVPILKFIQHSWKNGQDIIYRGSTSMIAVCVNRANVIPGCEMADPIIALSYLELYAWSLGLGTCWCDMAWSLIKQIPEVYSLLEVPKGYDLGYIMLLGYPAIKYQRVVQKELSNIRLI